MASSKRSPEKILGVIASIFLLSFAIVATTQGQSRPAFAQGQGENSMMNCHPPRLRLCLNQMQTALFSKWKHQMDYLNQQQA